MCPLHYFIYLQKSEGEELWLASCAYSLSEVTGTSLSAHDPLTSLHIAADIYYLWWSHNNNISHLSIYTLHISPWLCSRVGIVRGCHRTTHVWWLTHVTLGTFSQLQSFTIESLLTAICDLIVIEPNIRFDFHVQCSVLQDLIESLYIFSPSYVYPMFYPAVGD